MFIESCRVNLLALVHEYVFSAGIDLTDTFQNPEKRWFMKLKPQKGHVVKGVCRDNIFLLFMNAFAVEKAKQCLPN